MSGVLDVVGKIFDVVTDVISFVPETIASAATFFTGGVALGASTFSWSDTVSQFITDMGGTGILGSVLSGAITTAGYGAVTGGLTALLTGGNFGKGVGLGALVGGVAGGANAALNAAPVGAAQAPSQAASSVGPTPLGPSFASPNLQTVAQQTGNFGAAAIPPGGTVPVPASRGFFDAGGFFDRNKGLIGQVIGGVGSGLLNESTIEAQRDATIDINAARQDLISQNFSGSGRGLLSPKQVSDLTGATSSPAPRFDPGRSGGRWRYDTAARRVVFVPSS